MTTDKGYPVTVELRRPDDYKTIHQDLARADLRPVDEQWEQWLPNQRRRIIFTFDGVETADFACVVLADYLV